MPEHDDFYRFRQPEPSIPFYDWAALKKQVLGDGSTVQDFWRLGGQTARISSDDDLIALGHLIDVPDIGLVHLAYIPWKSENGQLSKKNWKGEQWKKLSEAISRCSESSPSLLRAITWVGLTLRVEMASIIIKNKFSKCHFIGDMSGERFNNTLIGCVFTGSLTNVRSDMVGCRVTGQCLLIGSRVSVSSSHIGELIVNSQEASKRFVGISDSKIRRVVLRGGLASVSIMNCELDEFDASELRVDFISLQNISGAGAISLRHATVSKQATFRNMRIYPVIYHRSVDDKARSFEDCQFEGKVKLLNVDMNLSNLWEVKLGQPFEIVFDQGKVEDRFDSELREIKLLDQPERDRRLTYLERSCQIISDRHYQDGRKDLEYRFRRMEIKARSYKSNNTGLAKMVSLIYAIASNFGVSLKRPLVCLLVSFIFFSSIYAMTGAYALNLMYVGGFTQWSVIVDAAKLSFQHIFPFGISADGEDLFGGMVLGAKSGAIGLFVGVCAAIQTLGSGILFFLFGLAVRTKLLIG